MKNHVLRPLWVALALVLVILVARKIYVPRDFGINGQNYTFGFYRKASIDDWKAVKVKYSGREYCKDCHEENFRTNSLSKHGIIQCENCHGPAADHPDNPAKLTIDRSRELCLRCHAKLVYPNNRRAELPGIDPQKHNPDSACIDCHKPHKPDLEG